MCNRKTVGQLVDEVADQYFASGMDAFTAGVKACIYVAEKQIKLLDELPVILKRFHDGLVKPPVHEDPADDA